MIRIINKKLLLDIEKFGLTFVDITEDLVESSCEVFEEVSKSKQDVRSMRTVKD